MYQDGAFAEEHGGPMHSLLDREPWLLLVAFSELLVCRPDWLKWLPQLKPTDKDVSLGWQLFSLMFLILLKECLTITLGLKTRGRGWMEDNRAGSSGILAWAEFFPVTGALYWPIRSAMDQH